MPEARALTLCPHCGAREGVRLNELHGYTDILSQMQCLNCRGHWTSMEGVKRLTVQQVQGVRIIDLPD